MIIKHNLIRSLINAEINSPSRDVCNWDYNVRFLIKSRRLIDGILVPLRDALGMVEHESYAHLTANISEAI
jgi:hypothetical protein